MKQDIDNQINAAIKLGDVQTVLELCQQNKSAALQHYSKDGTPMMVAAASGKLDIATILLKYGGQSVLAAPADDSDVSGWTPLMLASGNGHSDVVSFLLTSGADVAATDKQGWTALHHAAFKGHVIAADMLLMNSAKVDPASHKGETPLALAALMEHTDVCRLLASYGADAKLLASESERQFVAALSLSDAGQTRSLHSTQSKPDIREDDFTDSELHFPVSPNKAVSRPTSALLSPRSQAQAAGSLSPKGGKTSPRPQSAMYNRKSGGGAPGTPSGLRSIISNGSSTSPAASPGSPGSRRGMTNSGSRDGNMQSMMAMPMNSVISPALAVHMPGTYRGASIVYIPAGNAVDRLHPSVQTVIQARDAADKDWKLQSFQYRSVADGFLLDAKTGLVFWMETNTEQGATNDGSPASEAKTRNMPVLVGKLLPGPGGYENPGAGSIVPLTVNDSATIEYSRQTMRCLKRHNPVATVLTSQAKSGGPLLADLTPDPASAPFCQGISLAVPLCAVLGVQDVSELSHLSPKDLAAAGVDAAFYKHLIKLADGNVTAQALPGSPRSVSRGGRGQNPSENSPWASLGLRGSQGGSPAKLHGSNSTGGFMVNGMAASGQDQNATAGNGALPSFQSLIVSCGLSKMLPLAAEMGLLTPKEVFHWSDLIPATGTTVPPITMSGPEVLRLRQLGRAISRAQEHALALQASRMELLTRVTVGSLVVYEADTDRAARRGERLVGIVVEDLGPAAVAQSATGKQYKVRDLLDDAMLWQSPGQIRRLNPSEAPTFLRADLLPPTNVGGAPVTPYTACPGLHVHVSPWCKSLPISEDLIPPDLSSSSPSNDGPTANPDCSQGGAAPRDERTKNFLSQVVGVLVEPVNAESTIWRVEWPDGSVRQHCVGHGNQFDLIHLHLHKFAAAPLTRDHFALLLQNKDMMSLPVVRNPLWGKPATDDVVPGAPGIAFLDAAQAAVPVVWSRARDVPASMYCPDAQGVYPLAHGLLGGAGLTCLAAKPGVQVDASPTAPPTVISAAAQGSGMLVAPVALTSNGKITWKVKWASGFTTQHDMGLDTGDAELTVSEAFMVTTTDRVVLLNEVTKRPGTVTASGPSLRGVAAATAASAIVAATNCMSGFQRLNQTCVCGCGGSTPCRLGRPLFCRDPSKASTWGMLGALVKLNLAAVNLQPGCDQGPMQAFEPMPLSEMLTLKKEGTLGLLPRDDVGIVVKDAGPGSWRSLLVRKLGSSEAFWYDESVLLPASSEDIRKQAARQGASFMIPRHQQGVPVTDANAAPGMLVQRAFVSGAAREGSDKALVVGMLLRQVQPHVWQVMWPDGSIGVYKTGSTNRFQLCFVNLHECAGAPLLASTVISMAAAGSGALPVTDGPHCASGAQKPGAVRYVNDQLMDQGLQLFERAQLQASGMVLTSRGERFVAGGPLRLYELSHALVHGNAVTVYTAKRGLKVFLASDEENTTNGNSNSGTSSSGSDGQQGPALRMGTLRAPVRLAVRAVLDAGSGTGSGMPGGPTASREPVLVQDPASVYWEVEWANGRVEEVMIGTTPAQTPLRICLLGSVTQDPAQEQEEDADADNGGEGQQALVSYDKLAEREHFVRMLEPVMLLPLRDQDVAFALQRMAQPLHRAITWFNRMQQELCGVWWSASCLNALYAATAAAVEQGASVSNVMVRQLWRPALQPAAYQPDVLRFEVRKRPAGAARWERLDADINREATQRVPQEVDQHLATSVSTLISALTSGQAAGAVRHLLMSTNGRALDESMMLDSAGFPVELSDEEVGMLTVTNLAVNLFRSGLRGELQNSENFQDEGMDQYDLVVILEPSMAVTPGDAGTSSTAIMSAVMQAAPLSTEQACGDMSTATVPIGPCAILASGNQAVIQSAIMQAQRALAALAIATAQQQQQYPGSFIASGLPLTSSGSTPCAWMSVPEDMIPSDLGSARCLELINSQLFTLQRVFACINAAPDGGTADVSSAMVAALRVVREKVQAAFAYKAADRLVTLCGEAFGNAASAVDEENNKASDVQPFDCEEAQRMLTSLTKSLDRLSLAEAYGVKSCLYAQKAHPPPETPYITNEERCQADDLTKRSKTVLDEGIATYNEVYVKVVDTLKVACLSLTSRMHEVLLTTSTMYQDLKAAQLALTDAKKQQEAADKLSKSAEDDLGAANTARERREGEVASANKNVEAAVAALEHAHIELQHAVAAVEAQNASPEAAAGSTGPMSAAAKLTGAQAMVHELEDREHKMRAHAHQMVQDLARAVEAVREAEDVASKRRMEATEAKQAVAAKQDAVHQLSMAARTYDPGSVEALDEKKQDIQEQIIERMQKQVVVGRETYKKAHQALKALQSMHSTMPECLAAPEAVARYLSRTMASLTLACAAAAAESARTNTLALDAFLIDLEEQEAIATTVAMLQSDSVNIGHALSSTALGATASVAVATIAAATVRGTTTSASALPGPLTFVPDLPTIDHVNRLMLLIRKDIMPLVQEYQQLLPDIPEENTITIRDVGSINRAVLASAIDRAMITIATCLERLGASAAANVTAKIAEAVAAGNVETGKGMTPAQVQAAVVEASKAQTEHFAAALRAARVATLVADTARTFPQTSTEMPCSEVKVGAQLVSLFRAALNSNLAAQKECNKFANELTQKISKSGLGSAATIASVLCTAYSELAITAMSVVESRYWCREAVSQYPKVKFAVDEAIAALYPAPAQPAAGDSEGGEGGEDDEHDKKKEDPAEAAAKAAAIAESERQIRRYLSGIAVKMCKAAVDWASKVMSSLSDTSSIDDVDKDTAIHAANIAREAAAAAAAAAQDAAAVDADDSGAHGPETSSPSSSLSAAAAAAAADAMYEHPDNVVSDIRKLSESLKIADMAFRQAGNHSALDELDDEIKDVLVTAAEAARTRADRSVYGLRDLLDEVNNLIDTAGDSKLSDLVQELDIMVLRAEGTAECALQAVSGAQTLFTLVPLILPTEQATRTIRSAAGLREDVIAAAAEVVRVVSDFKAMQGLDSLPKGDDGVSFEHAMLAALQPAYTNLDLCLNWVQLSEAEEMQRSVTAGRPLSPTRRHTRGVVASRRAPPPPQTWELMLRIPSPGDRYNSLCQEVADEVFQQPCVQSLLQPYRNLLEKYNMAATAVHAAAAAQPTDLEVELLLNPDSPVAVAATVGGTSQPHMAATSAGAGADHALQNPSTNRLQMQRWGPAVATMTAAVDLVRSGFQRATGRCWAELQPLEIMWLQT